MTSAKHPSTQRGLDEHRQALHVAVQRQTGIEDRLRQGHLDRELFDQSLEAAANVIAARVALIRYLVQQGWTRPEMVVADLTYDDLLLREGAGR